MQGQGSIIRHFSLLCTRVDRQSAVFSSIFQKSFENHQTVESV